MTADWQEIAATTTMQHARSSITKSWATTQLPQEEKEPGDMETRNNRSWE